MDPTKCLTEILEELSEMGSADTLSGREQTGFKLSDLACWLEKGGFPPNVDVAVGEYRNRRQDDAVDEIIRKS